MPCGERVKSVAPKRRFDLAQRLGRAGLRERHFVGGAMQRAVIVERDQEAQLLEPQARGDANRHSAAWSWREARGQREDNGKLSPRAAAFIIQARAASLHCGLPRNRPTEKHDGDSMKLLRYGAARPGKARPARCQRHDPRPVRRDRRHRGRRAPARIARAPARSSIRRRCRSCRRGERIGPCVGRIGKFICIGLNYADHAAESNLPVPAEPVVFNKWLSARRRPERRRATFRAARRRPTGKWNSAS